jgi:hypothetical protein
VLWTAECPAPVLCVGSASRAPAFRPSVTAKSIARVSGGATLVAVVQPTNFSERDDVTFRYVLNTSWRWRVFGQRQMGSRPILVIAATRQDSPQVPFAEHDHVVQTLAPD